MKRVQNQRSFYISATSVIIAVSVIAGCSGTSTNTGAGTTGTGSTGTASQSPGTKPAETKTKEAPFKISVMLKSFSNDNASPDSKVWKQVEEYTNTKLDLQFTPDASYLDKMNITLASGSMPSAIFVVNVKLPAVANAIKGGAFWEIGPYLKDYPNLSKANQTILNNTSVNGKYYGLYTTRPIGRMGISYRKDWLDNLGMKEPKTIDEFYNMLKAFTNNDPDQNGKNDTYGMVVTKYPGPWDIMQTWFGAPNKWGVKDGKLVPAHLTPEYMEALKFYKKLYDEKLVNQDFAVYDSAKWNDPIVNGKAGVAVDVADRSYQIDEKLKTVDPKGTIDLIGAVSGPAGLHNQPTTGYAGVFLISKSTVKTEAELRKVLEFFDKTNDKEMQALLGYGIEGTHYKMDNGKLVTILTINDNMGPDINNKNMNQLSLQIPYIIPELFKPSTPLRIKANEVMKENEKIIVANPAEPFTSNTFTQKGAQLDQIVEDARVKFIVGKTDEAGFKADMDLWRKSGGDDYTKEMNEAYAGVKK
ncbi:extracellular solute-binding protein [Paenibacillus radicis (ex Xue et al. 2023)]|uniref:Extracellular solute-binding protein n=1 Tax=Paenibacillus radicis (ex Xue et al. 2023) TaxID=2972489 RepID=A0ABT1Y9G1_9BACL|nr:extracellular solute-binding protein [Paenibacillus radicis (ex Xue et al. 2023)]MCR8629830.1 extracellular solute-binding protein [Paenibacillus radicis (ex Xue et al. 2023)]